MKYRFQAVCVHRLRAVAALATVFAWVGAFAQGSPEPAPKTPVEDTRMERAQRDADKVFKIILLNADSPRAKREAAKAAAAAGAGAPAGAAGTTKPVTAKADAPGAAPAAVAATTTATTTATAPAPVKTEPAVARSSDAAPAPAAEMMMTAAVMRSSAPPPAALAPAAAPAPADDDDDVVSLEMTRQVTPRFRRELMDQLRKGSVQVKFEVLANGTVGHTEVLKSSNRGLNNSAMFAVSQWVFKPIAEPRQAVVELGFDLDE